MLSGENMMSKRIFQMLLKGARKKSKTLFGWSKLNLSTTRGAFRGLLSSLSEIIYLPHFLSIVCIIITQLSSWSHRTSHRSITELSEAEKTIREEVETATRRMDEINADLETVICQLGEAKVERHESSRAVKKQELIENLKRLFPGVVGY